MSGIEQIIEQTRVYGRQRIAREQALDRLLGRAVALHPAGFAAVDPAVLAGVEADLAERLLARVATTIGVARYQPRRQRLSRLRDLLSAHPDRARTLGGCRFVPWRRQVLVLRELAAAALPVRLEAGAALLWDHRIAAEPPADAVRVTLGYLGQHRGPSIDRDGGALPRLVHSALPALWDEAGLAAVPYLDYRRPGVGRLPDLHFRPANPLTRASFTVV